MNQFMYLGVATAVALSCGPGLAAPVRPQALSSLNSLTVQVQMPQPYLEDQGNAYPYYGQPEQLTPGQMHTVGKVISKVGKLPYYGQTGQLHMGGKP